MDRRPSRACLAPHLVAASLFLGVLLAIDARAQAPNKGGSTPAQNGGAPAAKGDRQGEKAAAEAARKEAKARKGPSEDYQESIRRTVERRRERRARRGQGTSGSVAPGAIVPWPMPPALIIRQTRETHDEIGSFLGLLGK
jgi:hypothetical protein